MRNFLTKRIGICRNKLDFILALLSFFFLLLTSLFLFLFSNSSLSKLYYISLLAYGVVVFARLILNRKFFILPADFCFIAFLCAVVISKVLNPSSAFVTTPFSVIAIYFVVSRSINKRNAGFALELIHLSFLIFILVFVYYYRQEIFSLNFAARIGSRFQNANTVGYYFTYGICLTLFLSLKRKFNYLWLLLVPIELVLCLFTGSRSALLISLLVVCIYLFMIFPKKKKWIAVIIIAGLAGIGVVMLSLPQFEVFRNRIIASLSGDDTSTTERLTVLSEGWDLFLAKPLFGWGYNGMRAMSTRHLFSHNNLVGLLCDFGIVGFLSYELVFYFVIKAIFKNRLTITNEQKAYILLFSSIFLVQFFYVNYQLKFEYLFFAIASSCLDKKKIVGRSIKSDLHYFSRI